MLTASTFLTLASSSWRSRQETTALSSRPSGPSGGTTTRDGFQLRETTSNNRLHAPDFAVVQHHFDAVRMSGAFGEDAGHDALRQCAGALVLLLHDLHAQPRANFTDYRHTHSFLVSCPYGVRSNQDRAYLW